MVTIILKNKLMKSIMAITTEDCKKAIIEWSETLPFRWLHGLGEGDWELAQKFQSNNGECVHEFSTKICWEDFSVFATAKTDCLAFTFSNPDIQWAFIFDDDDEDANEKGLTAFYIVNKADFISTGYIDDQGINKLLYGIIPDHFDEDKESHFVTDEMSREQVREFLINKGFDELHFSHDQISQML